MNPDDPNKPIPPRMSTFGPRLEALLAVLPAGATVSLRVVKAQSGNECASVAFLVADAGEVFDGGSNGGGSNVATLFERYAVGVRTRMTDFAKRVRSAVGPEADR